MNLLFFKAPWCTKSRAIEKDVPVHAQHIDCKVDTGTPIKYKVLTTPTFIAVDAEGVEIERFQSTNVKLVERWYNNLSQRRSGA